MKPNIDALKAALEASTAGEWEAGLSFVKMMNGDNEKSIAITSGIGASTIHGRRDQAHFDAKFIAIAHNEMPALLDYVARLEGALEHYADSEIFAAFGSQYKNADFTEATTLLREMVKPAREALASDGDGG